jgi:hypothetical protein
VRRLVTIALASLVLIVAVALVSPGERDVRVPAPRAGAEAGPAARAGADARRLVAAPEADHAGGASASPTASGGEASGDEQAVDRPRPEHPWLDELDTDADHLYDVPERDRGGR